MEPSCSKPSPFIPKQPGPLIIFMGVSIGILTLFVPPSLPLPPFPHLKPNSHNQQNPLQNPRHQENPPSAPPLPPKPSRQTPNPHKASRRLYAHHRNTQTPHRLQFARRPYLRQVLNACEDCAEDTEEVGPGG